LEEVAADYGTSKMVLLEYYLDSDYYLSEGYQRYQDYGPTGTPTVCFNGPGNKEVGAKSHSIYAAQVDSERAEGASVLISAEKSISDSQVTVTAEVQNTGDAMVEDAEVWFALYEDLGESHKHHVVRDLVEATTETFSAGDSMSFSHAFGGFPVTNIANVEAVVFLQSSKTREILQAVLASS
jgi:hypothetical protein